MMSLQYSASTSSQILQLVDKLISAISCSKNEKKES